MTACGTCHPPADGTRDREVLDRFADFLRIAGPPAKPSGRDERGRPVYDGPLRPAWQRYTLRLAAWRCSPESIELAEALR